MGCVVCVCGVYMMCGMCGLCVWCVYDVWDVWFVLWGWGLCCGGVVHDHMVCGGFAIAIV